MMLVNSIPIIPHVNIKHTDNDNSFSNVIELNNHCTVSASIVFHAKCKI